MDSLLSAMATLAIKAEEQLLQEGTELRANTSESSKSADSALPNWSNADRRFSDSQGSSVGCASKHIQMAKHIFQKYEDTYLKMILLSVSILNLSYALLRG